jgi:hypothetical protein
MKVVHLWDQCGYVKAALNFQIPDFDLHCFPKYQDYGLFTKMIPRQERFFRNIDSQMNSKRISKYMWKTKIDEVYFSLQTSYIKKMARTNCYFEIHDFQLVERFPHLVDRFIFHAHGSEIRSMGINGEVIEQTSELTRYALINSPLVLYSTPDLKSVIEKYNDNNFWVPHPIATLKDLRETPISSNRKQIYFPNSWDVGKGALKILEILRASKVGKIGTGIALHGLKLGEFQKEAQDLGVILETPSSHKGHLRKIVESGGVVSQGFGPAGVSDLEALYLNPNVFLFYEANKFGDLQHSSRTSEQDFVQFIVEPKRTKSRMRLRLLEPHAFENVSRILTHAYETLKS